MIEKNTKTILSLGNKRIYHPIVRKLRYNWFKTTLKEDGFTFEDTLIETFFSLQGLDCDFDEEKFLKDNSIEVSFEEFSKTLEKEPWLVGPVINGNLAFYAGQKRHTCKVEDKEEIDKLLKIIDSRMNEIGKNGAKLTFA